MRGVETRIQELRHRVFREVARMAYHTEWPVDKRIEELPYKIIPGEVGNYRNDVFLERAIIGERLRLAMGLPCRSAAEHAPLSDNIEAADRPETYYTPPLINVIKFACNGCEEKRVFVTDGCKGCLAHPCEEVCPKDAVKLDRYNGRSHIDQDKCIQCGRCAGVCAYHAIIIQERPCASACGVDAIGSDANGKANIDYEKCVSCGMCLVNCPFGAIADKSQIFQVIRAIQSGERVYAAVAPAFVGQFGPKVTPGKLRAAMKALGFADIFEVAIGADLCATQEAEDFVREVPEELPFMGTSCCPAWSVMAKKLFPAHAKCISMALTPMTLTARLIKHQHPNAKVVFIGPCAAKKLEAMRKSVRSEVDFVLTFEEMAGIFDARHLELESLPEDPDGVNDASTDGRNFAVSGGVAAAVVDVIQKRCPDREVKVAAAEGLRECRQMMKDAAAGKYPGYLLEGMACPGGCVAGAGTMQGIKKSQAMVNLYAKQAKHKASCDTEHIKELDKLVD
ncbi:4Fe-4S dicluster domain-containing protein [uncultured Intestinimonas sp.]|uniref:4Fe-4S dicluster domain-containing protein n=1 Tax=uncultured Intestinimonas sp. TaxID=1689265 RepID=UPI0025DC3EC2|nr:4Fe-4S dicluster domain-containing protein [uncultured Intestinimonas sp.]